MMVYNKNKTQISSSPSPFASSSSATLTFCFFFFFFAFFLKMGTLMEIFHWRMLLLMLAAQNVKAASLQPFLFLWSPLEQHMECSLIEIIFPLPNKHKPSLAQQSCLPTPQQLTNPVSVVCTDSVLLLCNNEVRHIGTANLLRVVRLCHYSPLLPPARVKRCSCISNGCFPLHNHMHLGPNFKPVQQVFASH